MPEQEMHTTAFWLHFPADFLARFPDLTPTEKQNGISGLGNVLRTVGALLLMCDPRDLGVTMSEEVAGSPVWSPISTSTTITRSTPQSFSPLAPAIPVAPPASAPLPRSATAASRPPPASSPRWEDHRWYSRDLPDRQLQGHWVSARSS